MSSLLGDFRSTGGSIGSLFARSSMSFLSAARISAFASSFGAESSRRSMRSSAVGRCPAAVCTSAEGRETGQPVSRLPSITLRSSAACDSAGSELQNHGGQVNSPLARVSPSGETHFQSSVVSEVEPPAQPPWPPSSDVTDHRRAKESGIGKFRPGIRLSMNGFMRSIQTSSRRLSTDTTPRLGLASRLSSVAAKSTEPPRCSTSPEQLSDLKALPVFRSKIATPSQKS